MRPGGGGRAVPDARFLSVDPATEEIVGEAPDAAPADMDAAIGAAREAFDTGTWASDPSLRARCLRQLREALTGHADELRELTVAEAGCPAW
ncbi:aldehyde dehydrogenase family protein [Streptosporangium sp. NPDC023615]|uniref:aldehyde dehydrogenase family protein n=1 Tax=Streptosporangium sp. NPDC023615 TaxID=3154794 RepID=UPI0034210D4E